MTGLAVQCSATLFPFLKNVLLTSISTEAFSLSSVAVLLNSHVYFLNRFT